MLLFYPFLLKDNQFCPILFFKLFFMILLNDRFDYLVCMSKTIANILMASYEMLLLLFPEIVLEEYDQFETYQYDTRC